MGTRRSAATNAGTARTTASATSTPFAVPTSHPASVRPSPVTVERRRRRSPRVFRRAVFTRWPMPDGWALKTGADGSTPSWALRSAARSPSGRAGRGEELRCHHPTTQVVGPAGVDLRRAVHRPTARRRRRPRMGGPPGRRTGRRRAGRCRVARRRTARSRASGGRMPSETEVGSRGMPSTFGEGRGRRAPSSQTEAVRACGATSSSARPSSEHRFECPRHPDEEGIRRPRRRGVRRRDWSGSCRPGAVPASRTSRSSSGWSLSRRWAAASPVIPEPTTTMRRPAMLSFLDGGRGPGRRRARGPPGPSRGAPRARG